VSAVDRAAEIIGAVRHNPNYFTSTKTIVWKLNDSGLLATDEVRAVLDAAVALKRLPAGSEDYTDHSRTLGAAVDAYLASRGEL